MKKIIFAIITIVAINACNSPQKMTGPGSDSGTVTPSTDTSTMMKTDTTMKKDSM